MKTVKIVVEKRPDGYVAYPLGLKGVVVGQSDTYEQALSDCQSANSPRFPGIGWMTLILGWRARICSSNQSREASPL